MRVACTSHRRHTCTQCTCADDGETHVCVLLRSTIAHPQATSTAHAAVLLRPSWCEAARATDDGPWLANQSLHGTLVFFVKILCKEYQQPIVDHVASDTVGMLRRRHEVIEPGPGALCGVWVYTRQLCGRRARACIR
jgi:hypothetical protein